MTSRLGVDRDQVRARVLDQRTAALLAAHVPLSLLFDLADPAGPHSADLFAAEGACLDWFHPRQGD